MGDGLLILNTVVSFITLALVIALLYLQIRPLKKKEKEENPQLYNEEILPSFNFFNGKIHSNGLVSIKLQNNGAKIKELSLNSENKNIEFRCGSEKLETRDETSLSIVPRKFNFSENYFEANDVLFSIKYVSLLNDQMEEKFKMENINSIVKVS